MAFTPGYKVEMQMNKKILVISDNSLDWNTAGYMLNTYYDRNPAGNKVTLDVMIEVKGRTYSKSFVFTGGVNDNSLRLFGIDADHAIVDNSSLRWQLVFLPTGDLKIINNLSTFNEETIAFPDGVYTVKYTVFSAAAIIGEDTSDSFVVTNSAEQTVINNANKVADMIFVCPRINIDDVADILIQEAMLFAVNKAAVISRKDRILNILNVINAQ
jgi:hypothetical protein